jgi:class 3 adenylate cyclase
MRRASRRAGSNASVPCQNHCTSVSMRMRSALAFGWTHADEADAERAVAARIGIASGLAVVGDLLGAGAAQEQTVIGETPNLAARLQSLAAPGCVVIDPETRRRIGGLFESRELGTFEIKGVPGPVCAWQVPGEAVVQSRFEAMHTASLAPLAPIDKSGS